MTTATAHPRRRARVAARAATVLLLVALAASGARAQDADAPVTVVQQLFDAMRARDSAAVRRTFHPEARLMSVVRDRDGNPAVRTTPLDTFVNAIGAATVLLDERISGVEVRQDEGLATVWAQYAFYADSTFSHCGVDAFQLARTAEGWKIIHVADTRRREGCSTP